MGRLANRRLWSKFLGLEPAPKAKRRNKYNNTKVAEDGLRFDSKIEHDRYRELKLMQKAGVIRHLVVHPLYPLRVGGEPLIYPDTGKTVCYEADFSYFEDNEVIEDIKGVATPAFRLKRAIMHSMGLTVDVLYPVYYGKRRVGWRTSPTRGEALGE